MQLKGKWMLYYLVKSHLEEIWADGKHARKNTEGLQMDQ